MTGLKLIQAIGEAGMELNVTGYYSFSLQDSKLIAKKILRELINESTDNKEDAKYSKLLDEVNAFNPN